MSATSIKFTCENNVENAFIFNKNIDGMSINTVLSFQSTPDVIKNKNNYIPHLVMLINGELSYCDKVFSMFENEYLKKHFTYSQTGLIVTGYYDNIKNLVAKYGDVLLIELEKEIMIIISRVMSNIKTS